MKGKEKAGGRGRKEGLEEERARKSKAEKNEIALFIVCLRLNYGKTGSKDCGLRRGETGAREDREMQSKGSCLRIGEGKR